MNILAGIKVIDLTRLLPGPYCTMLLGDLGAEVIKVEQPESGDPTRETFPGMYYAVNRHKKSICVDLKTSEGKKLIYELTKQADVVIEGFRPGVVDRLQISYQDLKRINPEIIYVSISGFGQNGPYRLRPGHDIIYLALTGAMSIPSRLDHLPERSGIPVADLTASLFAVIAILAALLYRLKTGKGQYIDVSMSDVMLSLVSTRIGDCLLGQEPEQKIWEHIMATNDVYDTSDGQIAIAAVEQHFWEGLCKSMGKEDLLADERFKTHEQRRKMENNRILKQILSREILKKGCREWLSIFEQHGVPAAPVYSIKEVLNDDHFIQRKMIKEVFVPHLGRFIKQIAFPVKMSESLFGIQSPPPSLGEHTGEILAGLNYHQEEN